MVKKEPEQYTPQGEKIPIPSRREFEGNLDKLAKAPTPGKKVMGRRSASKHGK